MALVSRGALSDIGLPEDAIGMSLLLFNVGIELGQLIIIALFLLIARMWHLLTKRLNYTEAHPLHWHRFCHGNFGQLLDDRSHALAALADIRK